MNELRVGNDTKLFSQVVSSLGVMLEVSIMTILTQFSVDSCRWKVGTIQKFCFKYCSFFMYDFLGPSYVITSRKNLCLP